jgi:hypothetical protein
MAVCRHMHPAEKWSPSKVMVGRKIGQICVFPTLLHTIAQIFFAFFFANGKYSLLTRVHIIYMIIAWSAVHARPYRSVDLSCETTWHTDDDMIRAGWCRERMLHAQGTIVCPSLACSACVQRCCSLQVVDSLPTIRSSVQPDHTNLSKRNQMGIWYRKVSLKYGHQWSI